MSISKYAKAIWELSSERSVRRILKAFLAFGLLLLIVGSIQSAGGLDPIFRISLEGRYSLDPKEPSGEIVVVEIDARSLSEVGVWPWPRGLHAQLVDNLMELGAEQIVFDVDFSTRSSPEQDQAFADALERSEGAVSLAMFGQKAAFSSEQENTRIVNRPLDMFTEHAWPGVVSVPLSTDGMIWQGLYGDSLDGVPEPSLSTIMSGTESRTNGSLWIDYSIDPRLLKKVSFVDVIKGRASAEQFQGKTVIVCATAQELRDLFSVPLYGLLPGGIIQVLAAESILQDRALQVSWAAEILVLAALLVLPLVLLDRLNWMIRISAMAGLAVLVEIGAYALQRTAPVIPDTSAAHVFVGLAAIYVLTRQISFQKILAIISQRRAENTEQMLKQVFDDSFDAIILVDPDLAVRMASHKASAVFDQPFQEGSHASVCLPAAIVEEVETALAADSSAYSSLRKTVRHKTPEGRERYIEYVVTTTSQVKETGKAYTDGDASYLACVTCRDITTEREARERLAYLARHDPLTGLLNRNAFEMDCDVRLETADPEDRYCVICLVVDELDAVKASLGLAYSDELLKFVAADIRRCIGDDAYAGVLHDDSFAVFMSLSPETGCADGWVSRLRDGISEEFQLDGNRVPLTVSVGYAVTGTLESEYEAASDLIRQAANALSKAKLDMRSAKVRFELHMEKSLIRRRELEIELYRALERDELSVFYQPQVGFDHKNLLGVEALVRWNHAELGPISPGEFIPIAEESGMILDIGEWVLNRATSDLVGLGNDLLLSVNVSPLQFAQKGFYDVVKRCLDTTKFPSERLKLEITESMFVGKTDDLQMRIDGIRELGCQFALDDFGTGYSGLSQLSWFPFSWIKIDRAFVDDMETSKSHYALVRTIVDLAAAFELKVVAEGVETEAQHLLLRELGCDLGQGYLYGRPMDLASFCKNYNLARPEAATLELKSVASR
ncbi:EAL domain-containing protein [Roseibium sediminis]|uniref:EAL domain-containing protein n=1 Tax=Roseibium sediminis TaxID=1775174 RepID=UPI00123CE31A|nr:EAL domain-containing protein [Roseibium sediminis]